MMKMNSRAALATYRRISQPSVPAGEARRAESCLAKIVQFFIPACVLQAPLSQGSTQPATFFVFAGDRPNGKMRWRIGGSDVRLFAVNAFDIQRFPWGRNKRDVVGLLARSTTIYGSEEVAGELRRNAVTFLGSKESPSRATLFALMTEPLDLLESFNAVLATDRTSAEVTALRLIYSCIEAHRASLGAAGQGSRKEIEQMLSISPHDLCDTPELLSRFVSIMVGPPRYDREFDI